MENLSLEERGNDSYANVVTKRSFFSVRFVIKTLHEKTLKK